MCRVERADPAITQVLEEVETHKGAWKLACFGIVEGTSGNRAAGSGVCAVSICEDRAGEPGVCRRPFAERPTVIGACLAGVDLLPHVLADIVNEDVASPR